MKIILVCVGNFQNYILYNIKNLILFKNYDIVVICNREFFYNFEGYDIKLIDIASLNLNEYENKSNLDRQFRNGFWHYCSMRLFILYEYIKQNNFLNCIHIENDVMVYENLDNINFNNIEKLCVPYDRNDRAIPSIIFIPNYFSMEQIIKNYNYYNNDMQNIGFYNKAIIERLPIYINIYEDEKKDLVENFSKYNKIFDAAAIGQYLGGVDERNISGDTRGFINPDSIVKYNNHEYFWIKEKNLYKPFIKINDKLIQIINLHIHSKKLQNFMGDNPMENTFIKI